MDRSETLHILAASGSSRPDNYTRRVLALAVDELQARHRVRVDLIDAIHSRTCPRAALEQSVRGARTERTLQSSS